MDTLTVVATVYVERRAPRSALLTMWVDDAEARDYVHKEFGPFDTRGDVGSWLRREVIRQLELHGL